MNAAGWVVMIVSVGAVLVLVSYCVKKVLALPPVEMEDLHGPLDIDTRDTKNAD